MEKLSVIKRLEGQVGERFILASQSPRRKELLESMGVSFSIDVANLPETVEPGESASSYASRIARAKCLTVLERHPGEAVLAADTVVVLDIGADEVILGKPTNFDEAVSMLEMLQDNEHSVLTAYCLKNAEREFSGIVETQVVFMPLSRDEIVSYVKTGEPMDKAGSYAIQGLGARFVKRIEGSYTNVVGLPLSEVYEGLKLFGITPV